MAKNFASIYSGGNDSSALNQSLFFKLEPTRGTLTAPTATDFLFVLGGGAVNFAQPFEASPHRSMRHNLNVIKQKTTTEWSFSTLWNIKQSVAYGLCIDASLRLLLKSLLGKETDTTSAFEYDSGNDPAVTFSVFENLDHMAKQASGCFVQSAEMTFPGDGMSQAAWTGAGKTVVHAGIGKSIIANIANTITLQTGESRRFDVGAKVMIVEADGVTRSADTIVARTVTAVDHLTDIVTLDGAVLADADGSVTPIYLCYWEPTALTAIDEPQTGLVGSFSIVNLPTQSCIRALTLSINNNHELADYCYGTDGLSGALFTPGARLEVNATIELNLNAPLVEFMQRVREFEAQDLQLILGSAAARHLTVDLPKVKFNVPAISVPDQGSIPISFEGLCLASSESAADEVKLTIS